MLFIDEIKKKYRHHRQMIWDTLCPLLFLLYINYISKRCVICFYTQMTLL